MLSFFQNTPSTDKDIRPAYPTVTMPGSTLGYGANNVYPSFPPKMSDGRSLIANGQSGSLINNQLLNDTGIKSNWEYRRYLTRNSENIVKYNFAEAATDVGYYKRFAEAPIITNTSAAVNTPVWYSSYQDKPVGQESDLKKLYLTREQLAALKVAPSVTQAVLFSQRST
jgi:hypothetical protein